MWDFVCEGYELVEIAGFFAHNFGISQDEAARDVALFLADLTYDSSQADQCGDPDVWALDRSTSGDAYPERLAECGEYRFGQTHIRVLSAVTALDESFFLRFQHRVIDDRINDSGADLLEISADASDFVYRLTFRGRVIAEATTINRTMSHLVGFLLSLEHPHKPLLAYCHAAAVSHRGRAVLMPGNSGVGKSTLTGFLVAHDFSYLGDDMIAIGENNRSLLPLPTCLSIKAGSWPIMEAFYPALPTLAILSRYGRSVRYVAPDGNYETLETAPAPSAIVFPSYSAGEATHLTPLRPLDAMIRLLGAHVRLPEPATEERLAKFVGFVEQTPAYELSYSELPEAMTAIEELLGSQP